jgi:hypothetical protein
MRTQFGDVSDLELHARNAIEIATGQLGNDPRREEIRARLAEEFQSLISAAQ